MGGTIASPSSLPVERALENMVFSGLGKVVVRKVSQEKGNEGGRRGEGGEFCCFVRCLKREKSLVSFVFRY